MKALHYHHQQHQQQLHDNQNKCFQTCINTTNANSPMLGIWIWTFKVNMSFGRIQIQIKYLVQLYIFSYHIRYDLRFSAFSCTAPLNRTPCYSTIQIIVALLLLLLLFFLKYPWVCSSQGLKAKSKLEWLLVQNVVDHESIVQKNRVKMLQRHRQTLEQKWWCSLLTRETAELVTDITQEFQSWQAEGTQILNGNRLKDKIRCQVGIFCQLPLSRHFCYHPHPGCRPVNVILRQGTDHSYIPSQWFSALPKINVSLLLSLLLIV